MKDIDHKIETARERATRLWHNRKVMREANKIHTITPQATERLRKSLSLREEILKIFAHKNNEILSKYMISIHHRHKILLKEKLRRLRAEYGENTNG